MGRFTFMRRTTSEYKLKILREFLKLPHSASSVHDRFSEIPGAVRWTSPDGLGGVYVPSSRPSPVLMVAHADVVGDSETLPELQEDEETIRNPDHILGADDRAGCAIIWALRSLGHGILVTDGEEIGCLGSEDIMDYHPTLREELQDRYQFMVEFDRKGSNEYKCYHVGTDEFRRYLEQTTGFHEPDRRSRTDIAILARDICGVNLSCGYMKPHSNDEYIVKKDWLHTLSIAEKWLSALELPRFERDNTRQ